MGYTATHFFWCRNCGKKLRASVNVSGRDLLALEGTEVVFSHAMEADDTHAPVPTFVPPVIAGEFRNSQ